jgi:peptidoglycan-associated lipoprotein
MNTSKLLVGAAAIFMILAGCSSSEPLPPAGSAGGAGSLGSNAGGGRDSDLVTTRAGDLGSGSVRSFPGALPGDVDLLGDLVVYFDFDSSQIRSDFDDLLAAHGRYLASDPSLSVRLEGHTDERGSREYNIGLGERRAQAVRQILLLQGASASQLSTVSYGEERPAVFGSDDEAYSLNRRVEIVYR